MKKTALYTLVICLVICFTLLIRSCTNKGNNIEQPNEDLPTKSERIPQETDGMTSNSGKVAYISNLFNSPINFWVKVVDQYDAPIENAEISVRVVKSNSWDSSKNKLKKLVSNSDGHAQLLGEQGANIHVRAIADGYNEFRNERGSDLSRTTIGYTNENSAIPSKDNPTVLILRKKLPDSELVYFKSPRKKIGRNGEESIIAAEGDHGEQEIQFKVKCWSEAPIPFEYGRYPWMAEIELIGGKLRKLDNKYEYTAPDRGYSELIKVHYKNADEKDWSRDLSGFYWIKLDNGNYGKFHLDLDTLRYQRFSCKGYLNVDGTKALDVQF